MKKLTRIILIFVIGIACFLVLPNKVMAAAGDTPGTAINIEPYQIKTVYYDGSYAGREKWFKFTAPESIPYEVEALNPRIYPGEGETEIFFYYDPYVEEWEYLSKGIVFNDECFAAVPDITAGHTYYIKVYNPPGHTHTMYVRIKRHIHQWANDCWDDADDSGFYSCVNCGEWVDFNLLRKSYTYDGKVKRPGVRVTTWTGFEVPSYDYAVIYPPGRKNVGRYEVEISYSGYYSWLASVYKYFNINPRGTYITKLNRATGGFTVRWARQSRKMSTSRITGYKIRYSRNSSMKNSRTVTVKGYKNTYKKISKLSKNKTYYVQVRTYKVVKGRTFYSTWSKKKAVKTR